MCRGVCSLHTASASELTMAATRCSRAQQGTRWWLPPPRNSSSSGKTVILPWGTSAGNAQEATEPVPGTAL